MSRAGSGGVILIGLLASNNITNASHSAGGPQLGKPMQIHSAKHQLSNEFTKMVKQGKFYAKENNEV